MHYTPRFLPIPTLRYHLAPYYVFVRMMHGAAQLFAEMFEFHVVRHGKGLKTL